MRFAESPDLSRGVKSVERNFPLEESLKDVASSKRIYPFSSWQKQLPSIADAEFAADKVDYGEMPETLSRTVAVPPPDSLDDSFVADDTFQDQGPGSVEIYKLDLAKEKTLLTASTPSADLSLKNKGKVPKKTGRLDSTKTKAADIKPTMTPTTDSKHRQSNFFDEQGTEIPTINRDIFGVGGVPELQVGCEGLEALSSSHKTRRSIDASDKKKEEASMSLLLDVTPVSLDFDYDLSYDEADFEEMDELLKLKRLETSTKSNRPNRGDIDASHLNFDHLDDSGRREKLPVRGDLGKSTAANFSRPGQSEWQQPMNSEMKNRERVKAKERPVSGDDDGAKVWDRSRRLLWHAAANTEGFAGSESERKRARRSIDWGFGENEGVVSSDELQTVNERRRQYEMRYHQNATELQHREIDDIRRQYEQLLEQKRKEEEERLRRIQIQNDNRRMPNRWEEEERRRNEMRRRQHEEYRRRMGYTSMPRTNDEETRRRQTKEQWRQEAMRNRMQETARRNEEERKRQEEEERRRRLQEQRRPPQNTVQRWQMNISRTNSRISPMNDEERRRKLYNEEMRRRMEETKRQDQYRSQEEAQRRKEAEEDLRKDPTRHLPEDDRRRFEERRRQWMEKRRQKEEDERRWQAPLNLMRQSSPNDIAQYDRDKERRMQEERWQEQKLREYIARNRPINISRADQRSEEDERRRINISGNDEQYRKRMEEQRRRQDEERKLQEYIRRNQPVNLPKASAAGRDLFEERRRIEEARRRGKYSDTGARRYHGPSASTYIDPLEEVRRQQEMARRLEQERRQEYEAEERRKELARRQREEEEKRRLQEERMRKEAVRREEEARRAQSRSYEENRKRLEAARLQAEERRWEMLRERSRSDAERTRRPEVTRPIYYQRPLLVEHRRRQETRPIPSNLTRMNQVETRRAAAERERLQAERRWEEENRYIKEWKKNVSWSTELCRNQVSIWQTLFVPRYQRSLLLLYICLFISPFYFKSKRYKHY
jgi:hypothetical protein